VDVIEGDWASDATNPDDVAKTLNEEAEPVIEALGAHE
jgi:hypothetical protein